MNRDGFVFATFILPKSRRGASEVVSAYFHGYSWLDDVTREPEVGTYAYTAREMSELFPDFDWDAWKDEMKDGES